jgi:hypothetical protein
MEGVRPIKTCIRLLEKISAEIGDATGDTLDALTFISRYVDRVIYMTELLEGATEVEGLPDIMGDDIEVLQGLVRRHVSIFKQVVTALFHTFFLPEFKERIPCLEALKAYMSEAWDKVADGPFKPVDITLNYIILTINDLDTSCEDIIGINTSNIEILRQYEKNGASYMRSVISMVKRGVRKRLAHSSQTMKASDEEFRGVTRRLRR